MKSVGLAGAAVGLVSLAAGKKAAAEEGGEKKTGARKAGKKLKLKVAFSENPRVLPLKEGVVSPEHIELEFETISPEKLFWRNLSQGLMSDASEMSISETLLARERNEAIGNGKWDWTPIPVFLSRGLFWGELFVNNGSGIKGLGDLRGKKVAVNDYCMTAALWFKITLKDLYGIDAREIIWYNHRTKELSHGGMLGLPREGYGVAQGVTLRWLTVDQTMDVMLDRGEIDAAFPPDVSQGVTAGNTSVINRYGGTPIKNNPRIRQLLDDGGRGTVSEFFRKTGCHQPNHHVIVKNSVLREHPWVALELYDAFKRSKEVAYARARRDRSTYLYFEPVYWREQEAVFGADPYPLGIKAMRKTIERAIQGSFEQGLIRKPVKVEEVYFRTTLDT